MQCCSSRLFVRAFQSREGGSYSHLKGAAEHLSHQSIDKEQEVCMCSTIIMTSHTRSLAHGMGDPGKMLLVTLNGVLPYPGTYDVSSTKSIDSGTKAVEQQSNWAGRVLGRQSSILAECVRPHLTQTWLDDACSLPTECGMHTASQSPGFRTSGNAGYY